MILFYYTSLDSKGKVALSIDFENDTGRNLDIACEKDGSSNTVLSLQCHGTTPHSLLWDN